MRTYLISLLASLAIVACGGGNDFASSGASAVSAAVAPTPDANTVITQSTTTAATPTTEPKVNGQIDERTGVLAPVVAQMTPWSPTANGGCGKSVSFCPMWQGPALTNAQWTACVLALDYAQDLNSCVALGGLPPGGCVFPYCQCLPGTGINCY